MRPALPRPFARRLIVAGALAIAACATAAARADAAPLTVIGIENEYADVLAQIGGAQVHAEAILSDPETDPHTFEVSPRIAAKFAQASLIVENGLGYDPWADKMIAADPHAGRIVINVQQLRHLPDSTPNPHLWYDPATMPAVADAIAQALAQLDPSHAADFAHNAAAFKASLKPWFAAIAALRKDFPGAPVAVTEPVGDALVGAAGLHIETPFALEAAIMNDTDPAPQDVARQNQLLSEGKVRAFLYNRQVTDPLTESFLALAHKHDVPVVAVYETMPTPGYHYQSWMMAETAALHRALAGGGGTASLLPAP